MVGPLIDYDWRTRTGPTCRTFVIDLYLIIQDQYFVDTVAILVKSEEHTY